ncbi:hypothetical protein CHS0354_026622, partial [Potamilus streckersoni]
DKSQCTNNDLKPHESDCHKFYKCFDGTWIVQDCPSGLVWNDVEKICDWEQNVPHCKNHSTNYNIKVDKSQCTNNDLKPHESDCHKFYKCFDGTWIVQDCPSGLVWNDVEKICDWEQNVPHCKNHSTNYNIKVDKSQCTNNDLKPHESDCHKFYKCFDGTWIVQDCPSGLVWNDVEKICDWEQNVPHCKNHSTNYNIKVDKSQCTNNDLKPHESDCHKFYKCFDGTWIVQDCPSGLVWNDVEKICDWEQNVPHCKNHSTNYNIKVDKSQCTNNDLKPHESDCHKFYKCFDGTWIVQDCPSGLVWNDIEKLCDWAQNVPRCNNSSTIYNGKDRKSTCTTDDLKEHQSDCHKFYKCLHEEWIEQECPSGLMWNPTTIICDLPINVPNCL